jgi:multiple sugar transport system permease protein
MSALAPRQTARPTSARSRRAIWLGLAFISPWLIGLLIFTLYPILASFYYSFCEYKVLSPPHWVGIRNYVELFTDKDYFLQSLWNTFFMFLELPLALILSLVIALLLNQKLRGMGLFRTIYYIPSVVPTVAASILWLWLLNPDYGLVNKALTLVHLPPSSWLNDRTWAKPSFIVMDLWAVGGGMIIYLAALQGVPQHLYEAADLDGASAWDKLRHVTLPAISPVIFFNLILGVIGTFQYFTQAFIMTGGGGGNAGGPANATLFYALYLYQNAFQYFRMGYACAMAWVLFLLTMIASLIVFKTSARWVYYEGGEK